MRKTIKGLLVTWLLTIVPVFPQLRHKAETLSSAAATTQFVPVAQCVANNELGATIDTLKSYLAGPELERASQLLLRTARRSPYCRGQAVQALIAGMNHITVKEPPFSGMGVNEATYSLWRNGCEVLAKLQATEALDLLVANLGLTDGLSISMSHYPAIDAVTRIGQPAIPKLEFVLRNNSQPSMRKFAVFCISLIGGVQARSVLSKAVPTETDPCVKKFMHVSLELCGTKAQPNSITPASGNGIQPSIACSERDHNGALSSYLRGRNNRS